MKYLKKYEYFIAPNKNEDIRDKFRNAMVKITEDEAFDYVMKNCKEWLEYPVKIGRVIQTEEKYFYSKPVERRSRDCENYYTLIMDNAPEWKDFPKRSKSFICSLIFSTMTEGKSFVVIPNDESIWGVCNDFDIYDSFANGMNLVGYDEIMVDSFVNSLFDLSMELNIELSETNYEEFHNNINELEKKLKNVDKQKYEYNYDMINLLTENAWGKILKIFSPKINKFKLMDLKKLYNRNKYNIYETRNEIWTESTCLFISGQHNNTQKIPLLERLKSTGKMNELR